MEQPPGPLGQLRSSPVEPGAAPAEGLKAPFSQRGLRARPLDRSRCEVHVTQPLNASLATFSVGGRSYPYVTAKGCRVCNSSYRALAEEYTLAGRTWAKIVEALPDDAGLSARNLADHFRNKHVPVFEASVREHQDREASRRAETVAPAVERLADHLDFTKAVVERVSARLRDGEVQPTVRDGLAAAGHLAQYAPSLSGVQEADYTEAFIVFHEVAREVLDDEAFMRFGDLLRGHPTLDALLARYEERQRQGRGLAP